MGRHIFTRWFSVPTLNAVDRRSRLFLRRSSAVLLMVGILSSICVYFGHHWFHSRLLPELDVSGTLGDALGGFFIISVAYIGQLAVSQIVFHDPGLGSTLAAQQLEHDNQALMRELNELDRLANTDRLTGAWNRRRFDQSLPDEMDRLARYDHPLSLLIVDIDLFKGVNDRFGHDAGDSVLIEMTSHFRSALRTSDSLTRWGGEEFIVLCPNSTLSMTSRLAERLREGVANAQFSKVGHLTVSIGVAECLPEEAWEQWFQRADAALYRAKTNGRNRVECAPEAPLHAGIGEKVSSHFLQLIWREAHESGHVDVDREHKALFAHANNLLAMMLSRRPKDDADAAVDTFIHELGEHFQHEEAIISAAGYPGAKGHAELHTEIKVRSALMADRFRNGELEAGELFEFLAYEVVTKHLLIADQEFFPYLRGSSDKFAGPPKV